jgi:lipoprotein-releasing system ATP-binding protein
MPLQTVTETHKFQIESISGLTVRDLRKAFPSPTGQRIEVLRGVSFSVAPGELVGVHGASGAGKSTLLHLAGGLEAADGGVIQFGRLDLTCAGRAALASFRNTSLGFIFQFHHLLASLTATENVAMPLLIGRHERRQSLERARAMLEDMGLGERAAHPVSHLSAGEQQRVAVARALINSPKLLLADEPTGNVDGAVADQIAEQILSYCHQKSALAVMATHNREVALGCDRVLVLENGRMV